MRERKTVREHGRESGADSEGARIEVNRGREKEVEEESHEGLLVKVHLSCSRRPQCFRDASTVGRLPWDSNSSGVEPA